MTTPDPLDPATLTEDELIELRKQHRAARSVRSAREFATQFQPRS